MTGTISRDSHHEILARVHRDYAHKLAGIEDYFRARMSLEQAHGRRMAMLAVLFFVWAFIATSLALWAWKRFEPVPMLLAHRPAPNLRPVAGAVRRPYMLLNVVDAVDVENALALRAQRQATLLALSAKRAKFVTDAEQTYMTAATPLENEIAEIDEVLEKYYRANKRKIEEGGQKRMVTQMGTIGMRRTPAKLVTIKKTTPWGKVVELIEAKYAKNKSKLEELIRTKKDPDKKALQKLPKDELAALGCKVVADDEFFVENTPESLERHKAA